MLVYRRDSCCVHTQARLVKCSFSAVENLGPDSCLYWSHVRLGIHSYSAGSGLINILWYEAPASGSVVQQCSTRLVLGSKYPRFGGVKCHHLGSIVIKYFTFNVVLNSYIEGFWNLNLYVAKVQSEKHCTFPEWWTERMVWEILCIFYTDKMLLEVWSSPGRLTISIHLTSINLYDLIFKTK